MLTLCTTQLVRISHSAIFSSSQNSWRPPVYLHCRNDNNKLENGQESNSVETTLDVKISNERFGKPRDSVSFSIMVGAFYDCIIPEDVESLWGPIPLQKLPPGVDNSCRAVTHG